MTTIVVVDNEGADEGIVAREHLAPYLSRHRLGIKWNNDPLSLDEREERTSVANPGGVEEATE